MNAEYQGTILIVDDEPANLSVLFELLGQAGYRLLAAEDGQGAVRSVEKSRPDLVLLDIKLPDMDGFEVYRQLQERDLTDGLIVIFLSVLDDVESILRGFDLNAVDYITKPFNPPEVVARVQKHLLLQTMRNRLAAQSQELQQEITERKRAEAEQAATMQLMQTTLDGMADPVVLIGTDFRVLWANQAMRATYGEFERQVPLFCYQFTHGRTEPCDPATCTCSLNEVRRELQPVTVTHEHIQKDGVKQVLEISAAPLFDDQGNLTGIVEAIRDISDRKKIEAALQKSERSLRKALEVSKVGHYEWDLVANTTHWSAGLYRIFGLEPEAFTPTVENFAELVHTADVHLLSAENVAQTTQKAEHELEFRIIHQTTGETHWVHLWGETSFSAAGHPQAVIGIIQDISDRKRAEAAFIRLTTFEERQRLARDLHDSMTQSINSLVLIAENALHLHQEERYDPMASSLQSLVAAAQHSLSEMRLLLFELNLAPDDQINLFEILATRLKTVEESLGVQTELQIDDLEHLSQQIKEEIFFIAFEALNNSLKHSQADQVRVSLRANIHEIELEIWDNGRGFDREQVGEGGMGLPNMTRRATRIGGELKIDTQPGAGTSVKFSFAPEKKR